MRRLLKVIIILIFQRRAHEVISFRQSLKSKEKLDDDLVVIQQKVEEHLKV